MSIKFYKFQILFFWLLRILYNLTFDYTMWSKPTHIFPCRSVIFDEILEMCLSRNPLPIIAYYGLFIEQSKVLKFDDRGNFSSKVKSRFGLDKFIFPSRDGRFWTLSKLVWSKAQFWSGSWVDFCSILENSRFFFHFFLQNRHFK